MDTFLKIIMRLFRFFSLFIFIFTVAFIRAESLDQLNKRCPAEYFLHTDGLCYPKERKPCPFESQTIPSTYDNSITATTMRSSLSLKKLDCPEGSIMMENKCRKIICSLGEYYRGSCLQPVCPQGLVWRQKKCQKPGYLTTLLEINNIIISEINERPIAFATSHTKEIVYHTSTTTPTIKSFIRSMPMLGTTLKPQYAIAETTTKYNLSNTEYSGVCCKVFTPRICKLYGTKWLCFNRKYQRCDSRVCLSPIVYLKAPEIKYEPQLLVMPPNPHLNGCIAKSCPSDSNVIDCSGCASLQSENCSPHCYRYICPSGSCSYVDLKEYCNYYPGENGCLKMDGCLWTWCQL